MQFLLKHGATKQCPSCGSGGTFAHVAFCNKEHVGPQQMAWTVAQFMDATTHSSKPLPHLHCRCKYCNYEWLEETAEAIPS